MIKVLFVCLGNICRSPTAEGVFRHLVQKEKLEKFLEIDSAGTHAYHVDAPPDERAQAACARRGIDIAHLRGRRATADDIREFDYVLAMDRENYENLRAISPAEHQSKIRLFMEFAPNRREREVPDPYFGGISGFDRVLDMIEDAAQGLLEDIRRTRLSQAKK
ncbi:MAG: low molecular weight phosphotyrosine protein phosphatase [Gammaproteobacteria bacterium]|nr:low molecular weight phosphotyrosine protein phosphatase [Gammaproteobacteria bacterium]